MAIVITNGTYCICLNENGKHRKTEDINKAIQYDSINQAKKYLWAHQDRKTQDIISMILRKIRSFGNK